jgi:anti-anti-sigma regulatory factor
LTGDLDMLTARALKDHLSQGEGEGVAEIVLDLHDHAFIDACRNSPVDRPTGELRRGWI